MESTPDYLYSSGTPQRLKDYFKNDSLKLIFILRDPVERFQSWYQYDQILGNIDNVLTFEKYLQLNKENKTSERYLNRLKNGNYTNYLKKYFQIFNHDAIKIVFLEELIDDPVKVLTEVSKFIEIPTEYISKVKFSVHNTSGKVRSKNLETVYKNLRTIYYQLSKIPGAGRFTELVRRKFVGLNSSNKLDQKQTHSKDAVLELRKYYLSEKKAIHKLTGKLPPWNYEV